MHHIYSTPAFVVHSAPHGEAGKFLLLFTRDFGMVGAVAQGIRLEASKLRYHIQDCNFSDISLVRGKEVWRITGAHELQHVKSTAVHLKILKFLKRLLHGEEKNEKLFEIVEELYKTDIGDADEADFEYIECLTVLRILHNLGYVREIGQFNIFFETPAINKDILNVVRKFKTDIVKVINAALTETQL